MKKTHNNKLRMYSAVKQLLEKNTELWEGIVAIATVISNLFGKFGEIEAKRMITEADSTGATEDKNEEETKYIDQILYIAGALHSHAFNTKDADLMAKTDLGESELQHMREAELLIVGKMILGLASKYPEVLAQHGVTPEDVAELETLGGNFEKKVGSPRATISERKAANERLIELITESDAIFKEQLDRLMLRYKKSHLDFYKAYVNVRLLVNHGVRHEDSGDTVDEEAT